MKVTDKLKVETEIPMKTVTDLQHQWQLDEHAVLKLKGFLQSEQAVSNTHINYKGTQLTIKYEEEIMFCGIVIETSTKVVGGTYQMEVEAVSATIYLDTDIENEMFQDISLTYKQMVRQMVTKKSGGLIGTIGENVIGKPLLCYKETIWQYVDRMASHFHSHVIADIRAGKPSIWFGLRKGKNIREHGLSYDQIKIKKAIKKGEKDQISYLLSGDKNYQLCDKVYIEGEWRTIYEKKAYLRQGRVVFSYLLSNEECLYRDTKYQELIIGSSLSGEVEKVEKEQIYIRLDLDGKSGQYPFLWYPETGNTLYAMPEPGGKAELYLMGSDERMAIGVRCKSPKGEDNDEKRLELPDGAKVIMDPSMVSMKKRSEVGLADRDIAFIGDSVIEIISLGGIEIGAKIVEICAADTIKCSTEW